MITVTRVLYGDGEHNDGDAIRYLLQGGPVFDHRVGLVIFAPTLKELPGGLYRVAEPTHEHFHKDEDSRA